MTFLPDQTKIDVVSARALSDAVATWFLAHARDLPWRHNVTPYRVWLSEIMSQQTRVSTASGYFERFVARFPTVQDLAAAPLDDVMALWSGLGYYSRCKNLHATAQHIAAAGGAFPPDYDELLKLPGVGPYTAAAIAVFAFDKRQGVLDGNVWRVLARVFADGRFQHDAGAKRAMQERTQRVMDVATQPKATAEGLMELGATLCQTRIAQCDGCPLRPWCQGRRDDPLAYPPKKKRTAVKAQWLAALVLTTPNGVWIEKSALGGLFAGLSGPPLVAIAQRRNAASAVRALLKERDIVIPARLPRPVVVERTLTHRRLSIVTYRVIAAIQGGPLVPPTKLLDHGLSSAAVAVLRAAWPEAATEIDGLGRAQNAS